MAEINHIGNIIAPCPTCKSDYSTFEYKSTSHEYGVVKEIIKYDNNNYHVQHRLFRCAGCGCGGLGIIQMKHSANNDNNYPRFIDSLLYFFPNSIKRLLLPPKTPNGIKKEFSEGETCLENNCFRAAAAMFRSVLDKTHYEKMVTRQIIVQILNNRSI